MRVDGRCRRARGSAWRRPRRRPPGCRSTAAATCRATSSGVGPERADADHRVVRGAVDVGHRREVQSIADRGDPRRRAPPTPTGSARRRRPRPARTAGRGGAGRGVQPGDVAALLVGGDQHVGALGPQRPRSARRAAPGRRCCGRTGTTPPRPPPTRRRTQSGGAVPGEATAGSTHAASRLVRGRRSRSSLHRAGRQPRTRSGPGREEETMTGIAISVEPAMSAAPVGALLRVLNVPSQTGSVWLSAGSSAPARR